MYYYLRLSLPFLLWWLLTALCHPLTKSEIDSFEANATASQALDLSQAVDVPEVEMPKKGYHIYVVPWREVTDIDRKFISYFKENNIPAHFTLCLPRSNKDKLRLIVEEIKQVKPDLVFSWGTTATLGLVGSHELSSDELKNNYITDIPVVFTLVSYPILSKIALNNKSSGRNVTGSTHLAPLEVQINALQQYRTFDSLGIIYNSTEPNSRSNAQALAALAQKMGFNLLKRPVPLDAVGKPMPEMIPRLIEELADKVDFLYMGPDSFIAGTHKDITTLTALWSKLATFTSTENSIKESFAMFGLVSTYRSLGQFTAFKASEILVEGKPAKSVPIETLKEFLYVINIPIALSLDMIPPLNILSYAQLQAEDNLLIEYAKIDHFDTYGHLPTTEFINAFVLENRTTTDKK